MRVKNKRVLKNGAIGGYVYYPSEKKWKWRIISGPKKGGSMNQNLRKKFNIKSKHLTNRLILEFFLDSNHNLNRKKEYYKELKEKNEIDPNTQETIDKILYHYENKKNNSQKIQNLQKSVNKNKEFYNDTVHYYQCAINYYKKYRKTPDNQKSLKKFEEEFKKIKEKREKNYGKYSEIGIVSNNIEWGNNQPKNIFEISKESLNAILEKSKNLRDELESKSASSGKIFGTRKNKSYLGKCKELDKYITELENINTNKKNFIPKLDDIKLKIRAFMIKLGKRINKSRSKSMVNSKKIVLHDLINKYNDLASYISKTMKVNKQGKKFNNKLQLINVINLKKNNLHGYKRLDMNE